MAPRSQLGGGAQRLPGRGAWFVGCVRLCVSVVFLSFWPSGFGVTRFSLFPRAREYGWNEASDVAGA